MIHSFHSDKNGFVYYIKEGNEGGNQLIFCCKQSG